MATQHAQLNRVAVFCGANAGKRPEYILGAEALGAELIKRKIGLVYGGELSLLDNRKLNSADDP